MTLRFLQSVLCWHCSWLTATPLLFKWHAHPLDTCELTQKTVTEHYLNWYDGDFPQYDIGQLGLELRLLTF